MIAACPSCGARYRIDTGKLRPEGARLRCSRCDNVFRVRAPEPQPAAPAGPRPPRVPAPFSAREVPAAGTAQQPPKESPAAGADGERRVLVAHPEPREARRVADALVARGLETLVVHDGVEAMLAIQRTLPRVVVLDAALPKMFGFQICEIVKRNESLRSIRVVLVGAIHHRDRYRRPPRDLYGADAYVEPHELPEALAPLLEGFGLPLSPVQPDPEPPRRAPTPEPLPAPRPQEPEWGGEPQGAPSPPQALEEPRPRGERSEARAPAPAETPGPTGPASSEEIRPVAPAGSETPTPAPVREASPVAPATAAPEEPAGGDPALAAETAQAERLARIIVSDVVLYNPEKFEAGVRDGDVVRALEAELAEGRALFAQRVDPRVGDPAEFLERELVRVARSRGMK